MRLGEMLEKVWKSFCLERQKVGSLICDPTIDLHWNENSFAPFEPDDDGVGCGDFTIAPEEENISICILNAGKNQRKGSDSTLVSVGVWLNTRAVEGAA